ncbi:MAG: alpha-amylase family glycosyl hydrolase [Flavobacteriaceae bacterium]
MKASFLITKNILSIIILIVVLCSCRNEQKHDTHQESTTMQKKQDRKKVVYQVFTRLFGNTNTNNKPWGTIEENGVGKFSDFTDKALNEIKNLGVTHIWYTGVPHHGVIRDYTQYGISNDDPDVVKGRAGSPYAVKDYYNVNPDLADNPANRLEEFKALIERSHKAGLQVIIDIVPNHVARNYKSITNPKGVESFGNSDNKTVTYDVNNNFYYNPGEAFRLPYWRDGYQPLGGEQNPLTNGKFEENPAKWTGNGSRASQPDMNDWYETVKINYGISPDGHKDFSELPYGFENESYKLHAAFWNNRTVPDSWVKFRDIALYWLNFGVDGFRYDMAEMVPVEFWSFLNSSIKMKNPNTFLMAEVYNPDLYRDYIKRGKMDYLYDKVQLYDTIKGIMQGHGKTDWLPGIQDYLKDIEHHMLHFLENHDEQRIASPEFAGNAQKGKPAMVVSATLSTSPTMIYFGQEVGEPAAEHAGFGSPSRTSIFDYIGVPHHQRWVNNKQFDGGQLSPEENELRDFYKRLLNFTINSPALMGNYQEIHHFNRERTQNYSDKIVSFVRWNEDEKLIIISNFDAHNSYDLNLQLPNNLIYVWGLSKTTYTLEDQLYHNFKTELKIEGDVLSASISLQPLQSLILKLK